MRVKLTAKHPRPASPSRAPVRAGSPSARKTPRARDPEQDGLPEKKASPRAANPPAAPGAPGAPAKRRDGAPAKARDRASAKPPRPRAPDERTGERRTTERRSTERHTDDTGRRAPQTAEGRTARPAFGDKERGPRAANRATATTERRAPRSAGSRDTRAPFGDKERSPRATNRASASDTRDGTGGGRSRVNADERRPRTERAERTDRPFRSAERPPRDAAAPFAGARKIARPVKEAAASPSAAAARRAPAGAGRPNRGAPARDADRRPAFEARERPGIGKRTDAAKPSKRVAPRAASPVKAAPAGNPTEHTQHTDGLVRVSKRMSELGLCSRREADEWIENGWVRVDGERIDTLGTRIRPDQQIEVTRDAHVAQSRQVTILLNKPVGYVSGQAEDGYEPAVTLITAANRWEGDRASTRFLPSHLRALAPAGRLDIDSTGLLVLTQDGRIAKQLIGEHSGVEKEYLVRVTYGERTTDIDRHFPADKLALLRFGLSLDDSPLKPAKVSWQNGEQMRFVLREGKKRQIRRMCELVGLHVIGLKRVRMGRVALGALPQGQWRYLLPDEAF